VKKTGLIIAVIAVGSILATAQDTNARAYMTNHGIKAKLGGPVSLAGPHACTVSKAHPCVFYAGDFNVNDPNANGLANENTLLVPDTWTYGEIKAPVSAHISASFGNHQPVAYDAIDPQQAMWEYRTGISEGNGGTLIGSGTGKAQFTPTGRIAYGLYPEYELLTTTSVTVPAGNLWFSVQPQCTNAGNSNCANAQYFESTTDGTNGINSSFSVPSDGTNAAGPFLNSAYFGFTFANWCTDLGICTGAHHPPGQPLYSGLQVSFGVMK